VYLTIGPANNDQSLCYAGYGALSDYHNRKRPPRKRTRVLVFILTVNNDWSQVYWVLASSNDRFRISYTTRSIDQGSGRLSVYPGKLIPDPTGTLIRINYGMVLDQGSVPIAPGNT